METLLYVSMATETEYQLELELDENYGKESVNDVTNELALLMLDHYKTHSTQFPKYENFLKRVTIKDADVQTINTAVDKFKKLIKSKRLDKIKGGGDNGRNN